MNYILLQNPLITPDIGLAFWTLLIFVLLLLLLRKLAWGPIVTGLKNRELSIEESLASAKKAREEMSNLKAENEKLLQDARMERDKMLQDAREIREKTINDAKTEAQKEKTRIVSEAKQEIEKEKDRAFKEVKEQVAQLAVQAAEQIIRQQLDDKQKQEQLVENYLKETKLN